jgi:phosphate transport system permease protein
MAMPGILRGVLVAFARAIGETAPLVALGALAFTDLDILPLSIFRDLVRPGADPSAAAPAIAWLFALVFALHAAAFLLRSTYERRVDRGSGRGSLE